MLRFASFLRFFLPLALYHFEYTFKRYGLLQVQEAAAHESQADEARGALEIQAELPDGAAEKLVRDVTENCGTLRFSSYGFEET